MSDLSLSSLPRFPLSNILSYLQQPFGQIEGNLSANGIANSTPVLPHNRDALSLLLTTKRWTYAILPLFRVPGRACRNCRLQKKDGSWIAVVEKYRFAVFPIQDPLTLLDRLNTRRLRGRLSWMKNSNVERYQEKVQKESEGFEVECDTERNSLSLGGNDGHAHVNPHGSYYQHGRTTEELAFEEWTLMGIDFPDGTVADNKTNKKKSGRMIWPAHLELLRFLDSDISRKSREHSNEFLESRTNKQRRSMPSPFRRFANKHQQKDNIQSAMAECNLCEGQKLFGDGITLLSSYPRSGNTLLRTLLERITSVVTGSDTRPDRTLSRSLALEHNLVGEGLVSPNNQTKTKTKSSLTRQYIYQRDFEPCVHIVKTHFPERRGWRPVKGNSVILLVRNPYDAIDSYWNLCCTNTHTRSLDESVYMKYAEKFEALAQHEMQIWCEFHYYWIDKCEEEGVPFLAVRYEDLVLNTEAEMLRIMKFLIDERTGAESSKLTTFWEWRIRHSLGKTESKTNAEMASTESKHTKQSQSTSSNTSKLGSYQPRSSDGGLLSIGKSIRKKRYPESVLIHMHEVAVSMQLSRKQKLDMCFPSTSPGKKQSDNMTLLQQFGYDIYTQKFPDNFERPPEISLCGSYRRKGTVVINKSLEIRKKDDPFGRAMTYWRRGETDGDTKPFPTILR